MSEKKTEPCSVIDVLLHAGLVGPGTASGTMSERSTGNIRAVIYHMAVLDRLERILVKRFIRRGDTKLLKSLPAISRETRLSLAMATPEEVLSESKILLPIPRAGSKDGTMLDGQKE